MGAPPVFPLGRQHPRAQGSEDERLPGWKLSPRASAPAQFERARMKEADVTPPDGASRETQTG